MSIVSGGRGSGRERSGPRPPNLGLAGVHHVALIVSDYERSKRFYVDTLGLSVLSENYRQDRRSWKLDLAVPGGGQLELFSFPDSPLRPTRPEACGLRHLALSTRDLDHAVAALASVGVPCEPVRIDPYTGARFTFFADPDGLPIEIYQVAASGPQTM